MQRTKFRKRKVLIFEKMQKHVKQFLALTLTNLTQFFFYIR
jgi:hypothetical protein